MRKNTDGKAGALISASVIIILFSLLIGFFILMMIGINDFLLSGFLLVYIIIESAVIIGVILALRQRLKELKINELEEAKKY